MNLYIQYLIHPVLPVVDKTESHILGSSTFVPEHNAILVQIPVDDVAFGREELQSSS